MSENHSIEEVDTIFSDLKKSLSQLKRRLKREIRFKSKIPYGAKIRRISIDCVYYCIEEIKDIKKRTMGLVDFMDNGVENEKNI